jgi:hypothetical protein
LPATLSFTSPRGWAFSLLGIHEYLRAVPGDPNALASRDSLTEKLLQLWHRFSGEHWPWFEKSVTYDNARLCQSLILSGRRMARPDLLEIGLRSLQWLVSLQLTETGWFRPIGSPGYFSQGGERALYDQQPIEANAMVAACLEAFRATRDASWMREARRAFEWFLGRNDHGLSLYDPSTGGCFDGLHQGRVNENQGAESTLAFHLSLAKMRLAEQAIPEAG